MYTAVKYEGHPFRAKLFPRLAVGLLGVPSWDHQISAASCAGDPLSWENNTDTPPPVFINSLEASTTIGMRIDVVVFE